MTVHEEIKAHGASHNSGLPHREQDPWLGSPRIRALMGRATLPEAHRIVLNRYLQLSAVVEWGAKGYQAGSLEAAARDLQALPLLPELGANLRLLAAQLPAMEDLLLRVLTGPGQREILLVGIDGLLDTDRVEWHVVTPLVRAVMREAEPVTLPKITQGEELYTWLQAHGITAASLHSVATLSSAVAAILQGDLVILVDGFVHGAYASLRGFPERAVQEPTSEPGVLSPKEAFNESIRTMTALIRRRIASPHLRIERYLIGVQSPTPVDLLYIQGIISPDLVHEVRARLTRIQVDRLKTMGMLEELIEDQPSAFFPQFLTTERPNRVATALMEGQFALLIDGEQNAKIAPVSFTHFLPAPDDYEERWPFASFVVWIRLIFLAIVLLVPSIYVAVLSVHSDLLPTRLLLSLAANRLAIPYPTIFEVLILEVFFEGMREATSMLPRVVGAAVTTVGGLVLGEGAIASGLASPATVVVVALTGIASFTIPVYSMTTGLRVIRFGLLLVSSMFGLFGLMSLVICILLHMAAMRSFGRPYLQPLAPFAPDELGDTLSRNPFWSMKSRPSGNRPLNPRRIATWLKPGPKQ